jgi:hypothetical protein
VARPAEEDEAPTTTTTCTPIPHYTTKDPLHVFVHGSVTMRSALAQGWLQQHSTLAGASIASVVNTLPPTAGPGSPMRPVAREDVYIAHVETVSGGGLAPYNYTRVEYLVWLQLDKAVVAASSGPPTWLLADAMRVFTHRLDAALHDILPATCTEYGADGLACARASGYQYNSTNGAVWHDDDGDAAASNVTRQAVGPGDAMDGMCAHTDGSAEGGLVIAHSWAGVHRQDSLDGSPLPTSLDVRHTASRLDTIDLPLEWLIRAEKEGQANSEDAQADDL